MYKLALVVGRFQPLHLGHEAMIDAAFKVSEKVIVCISSAQESNTQKNPFDYKTRKDILSKVYPNAIILPLNDIGVGNNGKWGEYVLNTVYKSQKEYPDIFVCGFETRRINWFDGCEKEPDVLTISRNKLNISSTMLRNALKDGKAWKDMVNPKLHSYYEELFKDLDFNLLIKESKSI